MYEQILLFKLLGTVGTGNGIVFSSVEIKDGILSALFDTGNQMEMGINVWHVLIVYFYHKKLNNFFQIPKM